MIPEFDPDTRPFRHEDWDNPDDDRDPKAFPLPPIDLTQDFSEFFCDEEHPPEGGFTDEEIEDWLKQYAERYPDEFRKLMAEDDLPPASAASPPPENTSPKRSEGEHASPLDDRASRAATSDPPQQAPEPSPLPQPPRGDLEPAPRAQQQPAPPQETQPQTDAPTPPQETPPAADTFLVDLLASHQARIDSLPLWIAGLMSGRPKAEPPAPPKSNATLLVELVRGTKAALFFDTAHGTQITIPADDHRETHALRSRTTRRWLARLFHDHSGMVPSPQSLIAALNVLEGQALATRAAVPLHTRVAAHQGRIYLDLADEQWRVVEIDATGWRVIADSPIRFRRPPALLPLPLPESNSPLSPCGRGGGGKGAPPAPTACSWPHLLRKFLNIADDHWPLVLGWLVAALRPRGPYPVLCLHGEQRSAKSTTALILRSLVDPNQAPLRGEPHDIRDLMIAAQMGHVLCFDNLSRLPEWLSNALCRLSTGAGHATRRLYHDDEEIIFAACRPAILVGIDELATRGDLVDRAIVIPLAPIDPARRRPEEQLLAEFEQARPLIFAGFCTAVSTALANVETTKLERSPRMADFAHWATAAEPALGLLPGEFLQAYEANRQSAHQLTLEANPLASAILTYLDAQQATDCPRSPLAPCGRGVGGEGSSATADRSPQVFPRKIRPQRPRSAAEKTKTLKTTSPKTKSLNLSDPQRPPR